MKSVKSKEVRLGIIGVGGMGSCHASVVLSGKVKGLRLVAVCDIDPVCLGRFSSCSVGADPRVCPGGHMGPPLQFSDSRQLIRSGLIDAVLIATPHYAHTTIGIDALENGLHVLVEKPISVHKADALRLIAAHKNKKQVFAAMFNQRTDPRYRAAHAMIHSGKLGNLTRVSWTITDWFRTQAYYDGGGWRATWAGEGGGVLLNQCPHNLDLLQWLCGMPMEVRAICDFGKTHRIEVEDAVTATFRFANGATGTFTATTGEAPGVNRLEICGDLGRIVIDGGAMTWARNACGQQKAIDTFEEPYRRPDFTTKEMPFDDFGGQHTEILQNFSDAIRKGTPLIAPAEEGLQSVELANAMLYASAMDKPVTLPLDATAYARYLKKLIRTSTTLKKGGGMDYRTWDISQSFLRDKAFKHRDTEKKHRGTQRI